MTDRFDILSPRPKKDGGTRWHKIGAAFTANGGGYNLVFDSLPLPDKEGRVSLIMREPLDRDGAPAPRQSAPKQSGRMADAIDDDIPW